MRIVSMSKLTLFAALAVLAACGGGNGATPEPAPFETIAGTFSGSKLRKDDTNPASPTLSDDGPIQLSIAPSGVVTDDLEGLLDGELRAIDPVATPEAFELRTNSGELLLLQFGTTSPNYFTMLSVDRFGVCQRGLDTHSAQSRGLVGDGAWVGNLSTYFFDTTGLRIDPTGRNDIQAATAELGDVAFTFSLQNLRATFTLNSTAAHPPLAPLPALPFMFTGEWVQDQTGDDGVVVMMASPDGNFLGSFFVGGSFDAPILDNFANSLVGSWLRN